MHGEVRVENRYTQLFKLPEKNFSESSPVVIVAGALLKDNQSGEVLAQLKFMNISTKHIKAIKVAIDAFAVSGEMIQGVREYQYLDLDECRDAEFGQKIAIYLPENTTRSFIPRITAVIFQDNSTWLPQGGAIWEPIKKQQTLSEYFKDDELVKQYEIEANTTCKYTILDTSGLWLCTCGAVNHFSETSCHVCGAEISVLKEKLQDPTLEIRKDARLEIEREESRKRYEQAEIARKQRKSKHKRTAIITISICLFLITITLAMIYYIIPEANNSKRYQKAAEAISLRQYDKAIGLLALLNDYKDSDILLLETTYQKAIDLMSSYDFTSAKNTLTRIPDYKDSASLQDECDYQNAAQLAKEGQYEESILILKGINYYKDSSELINQYIIARANSYLNQGEYQLTIEWLESEAPNLIEAKNIITECNNWIIYQKSVKDMTDGNLRTALSQLSTLPDNFQDVKTRISLCQQYLPFCITLRVLSFQFIGGSGVVTAERTWPLDESRASDYRFAVGIDEHCNISYLFFQPYMGNGFVSTPDTNTKLSFENGLAMWSTYYDSNQVTVYHQVNLKTGKGYFYSSEDKTRCNLEYVFFESEE